ncbi:MAG TPA: hypothetical protein DCQ30_08065 [Acidimicrobiaceae bacterium]|nr:hypothetical protein [Acidimicrobiaceae bacterium]
MLLAGPVLASVWLAQAAPHSFVLSRQHAPRHHTASQGSGAVVLLAFLSNTANAASPPPHPAPSATASNQWVDPVTPEERAAWSRVNMCEERGNWHVQGTEFSGGLGISESNWISYGGQAAFGPEWAASPDEQIVIAMRMQPNAPDQNGCTAW